MDIKDKYMVSTFYRFLPLEENNLEQLRSELLTKGESLNLKGLVIMGTEGVNSTLSGLESEVNDFKAFLLSKLNLESMNFKDSWANKQVFRRWKVKIRSEIVTIGNKDLVPKKLNKNHLSPQEWNECLKNEDVVLVDTRNQYETEMGTFKNAIDPKINDFQEFGPFMENSNIDKDKKVLIYCTGGIRCEKAILELDEQGFKNVYQLDGGILSYLKEFPDEQYEGECFVFDHRVGVNQSLEPSQRYHLCPHCGNPGDELIECVQCHMDEYVCKHCLEKEDKDPSIRTCSKNCKHHYKMGHKSKKSYIKKF